jgi:hypothetical protein
VVQTINRVWLNGQVEALAAMVDPDIVMVFPDFSGRSHGREQFLAGFRDLGRTPKFTSSMTMITKAIWSAIRPLLRSGMTWSTSDPVSGIARAAEICGYFGGKMTDGSPSGGRCSKCRRKLPNNKSSQLARMRLLRRVRGHIAVQQLAVSGIAVDVIACSSSWIVNGATASAAVACSFDCPDDLPPVCASKIGLRPLQPVTARVGLHWKEAAEITPLIGNSRSRLYGTRRNRCEQNHHDKNNR